MGVLKQDDGFSIIEALVSIIILGIIITLGVILIKGIYSHPKALLRGEAFILASQEIDHSIKSKVQNDTSYTNSVGNLTINRQLIPQGDLNKISVTVTFNSTKEDIVSFNVFDHK